MSNIGHAFFPLGEVHFRRCGELLALVWRDKHPVKMLSTMHNAALADTGKKDKDRNPIIKPKVVIDYNKHMGSVDLSDFLTGVYRKTLKTLKWTNKLVFYLKDLSCINAYIVYKKTRPAAEKVSLFDFVTKLIEGLIATCNSADVERPKPKRSGRSSTDIAEQDLFRFEAKNSLHWPKKLPPTEKKEKPTKPCQVCKPPNTGKRRQAGEKVPRPETHYFCPRCNCALHPECFEPFHTIVYFKK